MNANELIEVLKNRQIFGVSKSQSEIGWAISLTIPQRDDIIRELSRYRVRETAKVLPTKEDADEFGMVYVEGSNTRTWTEIHYKCVYAPPDYPAHKLWTCIPRLEVTP